MKNFVGSASRNTVLVGIDVAIVADLAFAVDSGESLETETSIGSCAVDFIRSRATVHTDSVVVHHQASIADAAVLLGIVGGANGAGHAVPVLDEEGRGADVADGLEDAVSRLALAFSGIGIDDGVDSASRDAAVLGFDPELA